MRYFINVLLLLFVAISLISEIYIIPDDFNTIQSAVDNAVSGDTLVIKPGIYKEKITIENKRLFITSKFFLAHNKKYITNTILNGEGKYTPISFINCPIGTVFTGFSIINGYAKVGGGIKIKNSDISLENLNFIQNTAEIKGGGIYIGKSTINIVDSKISKNSAIGIGAGGGGIFVENSKFSAVNIEIDDNFAFLGGGLYALNTDIQLKNIKVTKNKAESKAGGIYLINCNDGILKNLELIENSAYKNGGIGGGLTLDSSNPLVINTRISKNISYKGAGIYLTFSNSKFVNCLIDNNRAKDLGAAVLAYHSESEFQNVTIVDNKAKSASGISCNSMSNIKIINSILYHNNNSDIETDFTSGFEISYSMIQGNYNGIYLYNKEPIFKDYKNQNYHLSKTSFGINKGNPNKKYNDRDGTRNDLGCYGGKFGNW